MKILLLLLVLFEYSYPALALEKDFFNVKSVTIGMETPSISYSLDGKDDDGNTTGDELNYIPNTQTFITLGASFKHVGITLLTQSNSEENELFDKTKVFDLQTSGIYKRYFWEAYYQNYQGLYILEEDKLNAKNLPSANTFSYGFSINRFTKESFDPKVSLVNQDFDKKSSWTWVHGFYFNRSRIWSNQGLIPLEFQDNFGKLKELNGIKASSLGLEFGIAGMYAWKYFYASGMLNLGYAAHALNYEGIDLEDSIEGGLSARTVLEFAYRDHTDNLLGVLQKKEA